MAVICKLLFGKLHSLVCDRNISALLTNLLQNNIGTETVSVPPEGPQTSFRNCGLTTEKTEFFR